MGPVFANSAGLSELYIALFISLTVIGGAALQWPVGLLSDRFDRRTVLSATSVLGGGMAIAMYTATTLQLNHTILLSGTFLFGAFAFSLYSLSVAHVNDRLEAGQSLEAARGLLQLYGIGAAFGPVLAGYTMNLFGASSLLLFFSFWMLLLGLFSVYRIRISEPPPAEEQGEYAPMHHTTPVVLEMDPRFEEEVTPATQESGGGEAAQPVRRQHERTTAMDDSAETV
jgi:MFS family permease